MKDASDYLAYIKALIVANPHVLKWSVIREEAQGDMGLLRYKLTLDGGLLEMFELFQIVEDKVKNLKYILFKKMFLGSCMVMRLIFRGFSMANRKTAIANPIAFICKIKAGS